MSEEQPSQLATSPETDFPRILKWLPTWELVALFVGDLITLIGFAVWGQASHEWLQRSGSPFQAVISTAAPFMLAWLIVAMIVGTYRGTALYPLRRVIWLTALAGLIAGPLGGAFWSVARGRWAAPIFFAITTAITMVMLVVWRVIWSRFRRLWWPELPF